MSVFLSGPEKVNAQTCPTPPANAGRVTLSASITSGGTYRVWSRMKAGNVVTNDSFYIQIDSNCPILVGNTSQISSSTWTWVDYQNGSTTNKINVNLTAGNHVITLIGNEPNVAVDKILMTKLLSCVPTGLGDNCPAEPTATATPTKAPTPVLTKTPTPKPTVTPTKAPTKTPTPTPTVTQPTTLNFPIVKLHGIGSGGLNVNPNASGNNNPLTTTKILTVEFYDINDNLVGSAQGNINYRAANGYFSGIIGEVPVGSGKYIVKVKTHKYLKRTLLGIINITANANNQAPEVALTSGDVNSDGVLSVLDYNIIRGCFSDIAPAKDCDNQRKFNSDLSDDGKVNEDDYTIFLGESSVQLGD